MADKVINKVLKIVWSLCGVMLLVVLSMGVIFVADAITAMKDVQRVASEVEIQDIRQTLDIIEKQIELDIIKQELKLK